MGISLGETIVFGRGQGMSPECEAIIADAIGHVATLYVDEQKIRRADKMGSMLAEEPPRWACILTDSVADAVLEYCDVLLERPNTP